jgi:hypothetical protein
MTYETAVALVARFRTDKKEVVQILCAMASAAHTPWASTTGATTRSKSPRTCSLRAPER